MYHDSEQLELDLDDVRVVVPWSGTSPRELTRCYKALFLRRKPQRVIEFITPEQCDLFTKAPPGGYGGAPLLLSLSEGDL